MWPTTGSKTKRGLKSRISLGDDVEMVDLVADDGEAEIDDCCFVFPTNSSRLEHVVVEAVVHRFGRASHHQQFIDQISDSSAVGRGVLGEYILLEA